MKLGTATPVPQPANILTAIQQMASRSAAVWTLLDQDHPSCYATFDLLETALDFQLTTMEEALFLIVAADIATHKVGDRQDPRHELPRKVRTALYNVADFMAASGVSICPLVREYFTRPVTSAAWRECAPSAACER
jgi:hypothetical protein